MHRLSDLQKWIVCVVVTLAAAAVAYEWLDRPIAFYARDHLEQYGVFALMTRLPEKGAPFAAVLLFALGLRGLMHRTLSKPHAALLLCSVSLIVATTVKNQLKYVFGRTWPETWVQNNPSLIRDHVFGFNPFHGGIGYESFPSGHTTAVCAVAAVLWFLYPRWRGLYAACVLVVAVGLLGADYHFLSDVIAGGLLGFSTGWMAVALWGGGAKG
jgi:membrane-associated phospholipid phosphatase